MRYAVALAGELRTIHDSTVMNSLKSNLLASLDADLFMHCSDLSTRHYFLEAPIKDPDLTGMGYERPHQAAVAYSPKELEVLVKVLSPVSLVIDRMEEYLLSANVQYGLFIRWAELLKSVEKHERRWDMAYDWVIRARPDLLYLCPVTPEVLNSFKGPWLVQDFFAALPRQVADVALNIPDRRNISAKCQALVDRCVPEIFKINGITRFYTVSPSTDWESMEELHPWTGQKSLPIDIYRAGLNITMDVLSCHTNPNVCIEAHALELYSEQYINILRFGADAIGRTRCGCLRFCSQRDCLLPWHASTKHASSAIYAAMAVVVARLISRTYRGRMV